LIFEQLQIGFNDQMHSSADKFTLKADDLRIRFSNQTLTISEQLKNIPKLVKSKSRMKTYVMLASLSITDKDHNDLIKQKDL